MYTGDTLLKGFKLKVNGDYLNPEMVEDLEVQINFQREYNSKKLLLSKGEVEWNEDNSCFYFFLNQDDTLNLTEDSKWQVRVKVSETWVKGFEPQYLFARESLSREVL